VESVALTLELGSTLQEGAEEGEAVAGGLLLFFFLRFSCPTAVILCLSCLSRLSRRLPLLLPHSTPGMMSKGRSLAVGIPTRQPPLRLYLDRNCDSLGPTTSTTKIIRVPTADSVIKGRSSGILQEFFEFLGEKVGLEFGQRMLVIGVGNGTGTFGSL
jgi:hypothetical protein